MALRAAIHTFNWIPYASRRQETLDLERVLADIREAGFDAVEFSRAPMELDDPDRSARLLAKFRLTLTGMSFTYKGLPGTFRQLEDHARLCADLGGKMAVFFDSTDWRTVPPEGTDAGLHDTVEAADAFAEFAATLGLDTAYHNHLRTNLETPEQIDAVVPRLKRAGFCIDTGHLIAVKGDPAACIRRHAPKIRHVHFKDTAFRPDGTIEEFVELGTGNHAWRVDDWLSALREVDYDGWVVVEQDQTKTTPLQSARANREWLRGRGL